MGRGAESFMHKAPAAPEATEPPETSTTNAATAPQVDLLQNHQRSRMKSSKHDWTEPIQAPLKYVNAQKPERVYITGVLPSNGNKQRHILAVYASVFGAANMRAIAQEIGHEILENKLSKARALHLVAQKSHAMKT